MMLPPNPLWTPEMKLPLKVVKLGLKGKAK